jgi:hypothetical protein
MKRVRAEVEITRRTYIEFEVDDDADTEEIKATALEEAELAEWDDDPLKSCPYRSLNLPSEGFFIRRPSWTSVPTAATRQHGCGNGMDR